MLFKIQDKVFLLFFRVFHTDFSFISDSCTLKTAGMYMYKHFIYEFEEEQIDSPSVYFYLVPYNPFLLPISLAVL